MASPFVELEVGGRTVKVTNPDKVYFPARGETKLDLVRYYLVVAEPLLRAGGQLRRFVRGLDRRPKEAKAFYATIAVATLGGVALNFTSLDPVKALYWSAVVNGVLAAPLMAVMMVVSMNPRIMGRLTLPRPMLVVGWLATFIMALATIGFFSI